MGRVLFFLIWFVLAKPFGVWSQADTLVFDIMGCTISDTKRQEFAPAQSHQEFTSLYLDKKQNKTLTDVLATNTLFFIRSYGKPGVASISARGTSSEENTVLWNGFSLQDPLNGGVNPNLIPLFFLDKVEVISGGVSALYGSGSIGGLINLSSSANYDNDLSVQILSSAASFGNFRNGVGISGKYKKLASKFKMYTGSGTNDFEFVNTAEYGNPTQIQTHAKSKVIAFQQENNFKISKKQSLSNFAFYQKSEHEIPPLMFQTSSQKVQNDDKFRFGFEYLNHSEKYIFAARTALLYGAMNYTDSEISLASKHEYATNQTEFELKLLLPKSNTLKFGVFNSYETSKSNNLGGTNNRNRLACLVSYRKDFENFLEFGGNLRQEFVTNNATEPTFSLFVVSKFSKFFKLSLSSSKNYRVPTFNELYWKDAAAQGNANLKNEFGFSQEASLFGIFKNIDYRINFYYSTIKNRIFWSPENNVWTSKNQQEIKSQGIESKLNVPFKFGNFSGTWQAMYSFSKNTIEAIGAEEDPTLLNKQLIYTPMHLANSNFSLNFSSFELICSEIFTGKRFTSLDNSTYLPSYFLTNLQFSYFIEAKKNSFNIGFMVNNLFDAQYQSMPNYPTMGRNYEITINYYFKHKKIKKNA